jgi:hypothetical protein
MLCLVGYGVLPSNSAVDIDLHEAGVRCIAEIHENRRAVVDRVMVENRDLDVTSFEVGY